MADPFLLQRDGKLYLFYETKAAQLGKGQIGVAVSSDGGTSFQHMGVVLDLPWHLSYPFVFEHGGQVGVLGCRSLGRVGVLFVSIRPLAALASARQHI